MSINVKVLPRCSGIYRIVNIKNGKCYVGSTMNIHRRIIEHLSRLKTQENNIVLQRAWNKYGESSFEVEVLDKCPKEILLIREQYFIDLLLPEYNLSHLASGYYPSDEVKKKISAGLHRRFTDKELKDRLKWMRSLVDPHLHESAEYKEKMSKIVTNLWADGKFRQKMLSSKTRGNYKLSRKDVLKIRKLYEKGMHIKDISLLFPSVSKSAIQAITYNRNWKNLK